MKKTRSTSRPGLSMFSNQTNVRLDTRAVIRSLRIIDPQRFHFDPLPAGTPGEPVQTNPAQFQTLLRAAVADAGGAAARSPWAFIWRHAGSRLVVVPLQLRAVLGDGLIAISLPVYCDELIAPGQPLATVDVHVTFFVGSLRRAAGLLATTEERPRGPALVVDLWGEQLVALLWQSLLGLLQSLAAESGRDEDGAPLLPADLVASANGVTVRPLARHAFDRVPT